ncbi:MAG TPA: hypothetical protein VLY21_06710 [Nitrososphaerales archaeon]|nr:hypothetical protein [Nitrososphaerales archaeon]
MRPGIGERVWVGVVACLLVVAFASVDYLIRPHLPSYFGDNAIYVLVIILASEFFVMWRVLVAAVPSGRAGGRP